MFGGNLVFDENLLIYKENPLFQFIDRIKEQFSAKNAEKSNLQEKMSRWSRST